MNDLMCPYCKNMQDIDPDIHETECTHEVECNSCKKIYGVVVEYFPSYMESKMPCANGSNHVWKKQISTSPVMGGTNTWFCSYCNETEKRPSECSINCTLDKKTCWHCPDAK